MSRRVHINLVEPAPKTSIWQELVERFTQLWPTFRHIDYRKYLRSKKWKDKRLRAIAKANNRCQVCNSPHQLSVHHRTYRHIGKERLTDLTVLCKNCHDLFHKHRRLYKG